MVVFIATHHLRKIGDRITLNFTLPGSDKSVVVETEVRWIRENTALMRADGGTGMGVRFINLTPEATGHDHVVHPEPRVALLRRRGIVLPRREARGGCTPAI